MDSPPLSPSGPPQFFRQWLVPTALLLAVAAYVFLIASHMGAYAGGSDTSGYLNNAQFLRHGHTTLPQRSLPGLPPEKLGPYAYMPLGFREVHGHEMVPTYPIGLPLLMVAASFVTGWAGAPAWALGLHALLGVALMYVFARQTGLSRGWAGLAVLMLALSPLYLFMSLQVMSDMPALVWILAAVILAERSRTHPAPGWPLAAGAAFAVSVLVRPNDLIALAPLAVALGLSWRRWLLFGLGGLPGAVVLAIYNQSAYGSILTSGYGEVSSAFTRDVIGLTLVHYAHWLPVLLTPVGVLALGLPWLVRTQRRWTLLLAAWIAVYLGFFVSYYHTHETWWYLRFVLPAFPALIVAALLVLRRLADRVPDIPHRWILPAGLVALIAGWSWHWTTKFDAIGIGYGESVYGEAAQWALKHLPANAVVATMQTSGALFYYTNFTLVRWDQLPPKDAAAVNAALAADRLPLYAVLFPFEVQEVLEQRLPGQWTKVGAARHVTIWRRESAAPTPAIP